MRGAREIDERRRTYAVPWSEAIECNEAGGPFLQPVKNRSHGRQAGGDFVIDLKSKRLL
jgi:hypothetical protein